MKSNLAKKIVSITVIALVVALVITTIVLALVPKKMADPIASGYSRVVIYQDGVSHAYTYNPNASTDEEKEPNKVIDTIKDLHDKSLKDNVLSALFQGTGKFKMEVKKISEKKNASTNIPGEEGNAIKFEYLGNDAQVLKINGEVYKDEATLGASTVTFNSIIMPLGDSENFEECIIYLIDSDDSCFYTVSFLACQAELNDYVSGLESGLSN